MTKSIDQINVQVGNRKSQMLVSCVRKVKLQYIWRTRLYQVRLSAHLKIDWIINRDSQLDKLELLSTEYAVVSRSWKKFTAGWPSEMIRAWKKTVVAASKWSLK